MTGYIEALYFIKIVLIWINKEILMENYISEKKDGKEALIPFMSIFVYSRIITSLKKLTVLYSHIGK